MEQENIALASVEQEEGIAYVPAVVSSIGGTGINPFGYSKAFEVGQIRYG
jgi:hypothetical protein